MNNEDTRILNIEELPISLALYDYKSPIVFVNAQYHYFTDELVITQVFDREWKALAELNNDLILLNKVRTRLKEKGLV